MADEFDVPTLEEVSDLLAQVAALTDDVADGPWEAVRIDGDLVVAEVAARGAAPHPRHAPIVADIAEDDEPAAAFIAAARTLLPALADVLQRLVDSAPADRVIVAPNRDESGFRFTGLGGNNRKVGTSGEGLVNEPHAVSMARRTYPFAAVKVIDGEDPTRG